MQSLTNKSVLEVECGSRHGIEYVARNLNAARCVAVSSDRKLVNRLKQENTSPKVVYKHSSIQDLPREADLGKFDCILAINALGMD
jgi:cyclopropane fatty-acyl-phospholipid synthase-like methyltransferase